MLGVYHIYQSIMCPSAQFAAEPLSHYEAYYIPDHTHVLSCPWLISVARVTEYRATDVIRLFTAPGAELS